MSVGLWRTDLSAPGPLTVVHCNQDNIELSYLDPHTRALLITEKEWTAEANSLLLNRSRLASAVTSRKEDVGG